MAYYNINKILENDVSFSNLYQMKGVNLDQDRKNNYHFTAFDSMTSGSQLGPGLNPWQSHYMGISGTSTTLQVGMVGFNYPALQGTSNTPREVKASNLRGMDWKYHPGYWGDKDLDAAANCVIDGNSSTVSVFDATQNPGWIQGKYIHMYFYAGVDPNGTSLPPQWNWACLWRRTSSGNQLAIAIGTITQSGNSINYGNPTTDTFSQVIGNNGQLVPLNIGQGEGTPYNASTNQGGSTQMVLHYRNGSAQNKARVVTLNTSVPSGGTSPTISIGSERSPTNRGNPVFTHGGVNMGIGTGWAGFHRGANYQRIQYANWTSGTNFGTLSDYLVASRSSTTTLNHGWMVKLSDELAMWFYPRRSGNSSGSSRLIGACVLETSGAAKAPILRGSVDLATHDIGSISTEACTAAVGSSDSAGTLFGIVTWAENSAGNDAFNIMPWKYVVSSNTLTFSTSDILTADTDYTNTNSYRMHNSIKCLGYNSEENSNFYEILVPFGSSTGGGIARFVVKQEGDKTRNGACVFTGQTDRTQTEFGTSARIVGQHSFINYPTGRQWMLPGFGASYAGNTWSMYPWANSSNQAKIIATTWLQSI